MGYHRFFRTAFCKATLALAALGIALPVQAMPCPDDAAATCECVHGPVYLPGLPGAPEWFEMSSPPDGFWRPELNDPRWAGAPLVGLIQSAGTTGTESAQARVLTYGDYMYIVVQVLADDEGPGSNDSVLFGITAGSGSQAYALRVRAVGDGSGGVAPAASSSGDPAPQDNPLPEPPSGTSVVHWDSDASGSFASSVQQAGSLSFVDQIAVWKPAAATIPVGTNRNWAVTLRINKAASGLNPSPGSIRLFVGTSVRMDRGGIPATVSYANTAPVTSGGVGSTIIPASSSNWGRYAEIGTACTAGMSLSSADIGVAPIAAPDTDPTATLTRKICAADPCPASTPGGNPENIFRATIRNVDTSAGLADWEVRARFRFADWGSTVTNRKYGPWKEIATTPVGTAILTGPDTPLTGTNGWYWQDEDDGAAANSVVIDYQCDKGAGTYCPTLSNPANNHQCLLVELGQPPTGTREIGTTAVYTNMQFVSLSTVDQQATISVQGLKDMTGVAKDRDVYLYVQTENMPAHQREPLWLPSEQMAMAAKLAQNPTPLPLPEAKAQPGRRPARAAAMQPKVDPKAAEAKRKLIAERAGRIAATAKKIGDVRVSSTLAMSQTQLLDEVWPTYRIRPYYDTGDKQVIDGQTVPVLAPMVPFGYHMSHDGPFYGFTHALQAVDPGVVLTKLSDYWYKVTVKSEGAVHLRTIVTAEEKPVQAGGGTEPPKVDCQLCKQFCPECEVKPGRCNCRLPGAPVQGAIGGTLSVLVGLALLWSRRRNKRN